MLSHPSTMSDQRPDRPVEDLEEEMPKGAEPGAIPALESARFGPGDWLDEDDPVIVPELGDRLRAYPVRVLDWHEIVHDEIAGRPVIVTYCPLCGTGPVYDRRLDDQVLSFIVSGRLYRNDLVMMDQETGSLWPQILGQALHGPLTGRSLDRLPSLATTWGRLRAEHPDAVAMEPPGAYPRSRYQASSHEGYEAKEEALFPRTVTDDRLHPKRWVVGLATENDAVAVPLDVLRERSPILVDVGDRQAVVGHRTGSPVAWWAGDRELVLVDGEVRDEAGQRFDPSTGQGASGDRLERAQVLPGYWLAWVEFHPDTRLLRP